MKHQKILTALLWLFPICFSASGKVQDFKKMWIEKDAAKRMSIQDKLQAVLDVTSKKEFDTFDNDPRAKSSNPALQFYDLCLDRLAEDIPRTEVRPGTVVIWYLYNMGFVIKTPTVCFGVDIHHRRAVKLAGVLDFSVTTHNHDDHWSMPLLNTLNDNGKPLVTNFYPNLFYTKARSFTHNISGVTIHCGEADHKPTLKKFTMPMEIVCPTGDKQFVFFTSGDCWSHEFLEKKSEKIDLYAVHPRCGMKAVNAALKLHPQLTFIAHLHELGHDINVWRWKFADGRSELEEFSKNGQAAYVPVWGEKFLWDGEKIHGCRE